MRKKGLALFLSLCMMFGSVGQVYAAQSNENVEAGREEVVIEKVESSVFDALPDQEDLFSGYVDKELGVTLFSEAEPTEDRGMGNKKLTGDPLILYRSMKREIAQVADGQRASTAFDVPAQIDLTMSLEELGFEGATELTEEMQQTVTNVVFERLDLDNVETYLLLDCPYDLYWYDKTSEINVSYSYDVGENTISVTDIKFFMQPVEEYAGAEDCTVDTSKTGAARNAAVKAKSIVSAAASMSDYEKLKYYKEQICQMTSYNHDAVAEDSGINYGNPWQMIWVFDDDPATKVVCEGYSKAFEYLCELSTFQDDISARLVTGNMISNGDFNKPEPHMWNVVTMEDDKNYLVDVTNCDDDTIGEPDNLFLASGYGNVDDGYDFEFEEYEDDILYQYADYVKTSYGKDLLELADHNYDESVKPYCAHKNVELKDQVDATCVDEGYTGDKICSRCGETVEGEIIPATGQHTYATEYTEDTPATCSQPGSKSRHCTAEGCDEKTDVTETEMLPHSGGTATCIDQAICENCGNAYGEKNASNHVGEKTVTGDVAATCTENGYTGDITCGSCHAVESGQVIPAKGHTWDAGVQTIAPTYTTKGQMTYTCTIEGCEGTKTVDIPVLKRPVVKVNKIAISGLSKQIAAGKKVQLTATTAPANATDKGIIWTSSNTKIATVSAKGLVTVKAKTGGKSVTIVATAHDGSKVKATYVIKSMKAPVTKITGKNPKAVKVGKTVKLSAKVTAKSGANKKLKWTSSNTKFATVTNGKVKALAAGKGKSVKITAMATDGSGKKKVFTVKIK